MKLTHDKLGHVGSSKMIWALKQRCVWPGLDKLVKTYVKQCLQCQCMRKENVGKAPMGEMPIFSVPFQHVANSRSISKVTGICLLADIHLSKFKVSRGYTNENSSSSGMCRSIVKDIFS